MEKVRVRYPPSPTGYCHVGTARMAVVNYLFAKKHGGKIFFRSEDTDKERSKREYEEDIIEQLHWLGLGWDDFSRTTELVESHKTAMHKLVGEDKAYVSKEESKKNPGEFVEVVRLRNPGRSVTFTDVIRGDITFDTTELGDFVIGRAIDDPLYNFAVVYDDGTQGITHVIRGEDHISNTPRQILIQEALGFPRPVYAHYPLHLGADKSKLSKRTGDVAVRSYREKGFLSPALLNYIAILGWTPPSGKEILSLDEMVAEFELENLHKSGAVFDMEKLRWYNRHYLSEMSVEDFNAHALTVLRAAITARNLSWNDAGEKILSLIREKISVWGDISDLVAEGEFDFAFSAPVLDPAKIPGKGDDAAAGAKHLHHVRALLEKLSEADFRDSERVKAALWDYATEAGRGSVLWPLRYSLSGREKSPDPFLIASVIGKSSTIERVEIALNTLQSS